MRNEFSKNYYLLSITGRRGFLKITYERSLQKIDCIIFKKIEMRVVEVKQIYVQIVHDLRRSLVSKI